MNNNIGDIKKLRELTGISVLKCKKALAEAGGDIEKAKALLIEQGAKVAEDKRNREAAEGLIHSYIHATGKIGVLLELSCETDFVARNDEFKALAQEIALQIASMNPSDIDELRAQEFIKDSTKTIQDLITAAVLKLGENIKVRRFYRFQVGENVEE